MSENNRWWKILTSMKMGLFLLLTISIASALGTVVPQALPKGSVSLPVRIFRLWDVYHSWWYITLLSLLALNLMACSFCRFKPMLVSISQSRHLLERQDILKLKVFTSFSFPGKLNEVNEQVVKLLTSQGYEVWAQAEEGLFKIGARRGHFYALGSFITHISLIIILLGVLIGGIWGYKGIINAPVGSTFSIAEVPGIEEAVKEDNFQIRVNDFWIEHYDSGAVSGYFSRLTVIENGKTVKIKTIGVNDPLEYRGVKLYQSHYGKLVRIKVYSEDGSECQQGAANEGEIFKVLDTDYTVLVYRIKYSSNNPECKLAQPEVIYSIYKGEELAEVGRAGFNQPIQLGEGKKTFAFSGLVPITGLQVKKDPGVPIVITGSLLILLGIGLTVMLQHHKIWAVLEQQGVWVNVILGGKSRKNRLAFNDHFHSLAEKLKSQQDIHEKS